MPVKISPLKILNDLGYEMVDIESDEDYLSALMESIVSLQKAGASGRKRADILQKELIRVRRERKAAAPSAGMKVTQKKIRTSKFFDKEEKQTTEADTTGTSSLAIRSRTGKIDTKKLIPESTEEKGGVLVEILTGVNSIAETLKGQKKQDKKHKNFLQRLAERFKRRKEENKLEFKIFDGLKKTATKLLAPFKSAWQKLMGFIGKVLLGRILFKILEWMGNEKNRDKLQSIIKFFEDWWPTMLAAYLLFGTGFTKMVAGIINAVAWSIKQLAILIPKLIAAIAKIKGGKILKGLGGLLGGGKGKAFTKLFSVGAGAFAGGGLVKELHYYNEGGQVPGSGNKDTVPAMLTPGEFVMSKGAVEKYGVNTMESMNAAAGGTNIPTVMGGLEVRNPSFGDGMGLGGGGGGTNALTEQAKTKTPGSALRDFFSGDDGKSTRMTDLETSQRMSGGGLVSNLSNSISNFYGGGLVQYLNNGGKVSEMPPKKGFEGWETYDTSGMKGVVVREPSADKTGLKKFTLADGSVQYESIPSLSQQVRSRSRDRSTKKKGGGLFGGLKRVVGGTADQLTGNLFDFDKRSGGGLVRKTAGAVGGLFGGGKKEGGTKGSSGILGPISSNVDGMVNRDKYEVQPKSKEKKNTVIAYEQAVNEQQQQNQEATSDGNEIPNFTIRPSFMIDEAKVDVLGIMV